MQEVIDADTVFFYTYPDLEVDSLDYYYKLIEDDQDRQYRGDFVACHPGSMIGQRAEKRAR